MSTAPKPSLKISVRRNQYTCYYSYRSRRRTVTVADTCNDFELRLLENGNARSSSRAGFDWFHLSVAFREADAFIHHKIMNAYESNVTLTTPAAHPSSLCLFKTDLDDDNKEVKVNEIRFWSIPPADYDSNFYERNYGRSFKYFTPYSPWLADTYVTKSSTPIDTWNALLVPTRGITYLSDANRFKWDNEPD